jgi:hypothetical protein
MDPLRTMPVRSRTDGIGGSFRDRRHRSAPGRALRHRHDGLARLGLFLRPHVSRRQARPVRARPRGEGGSAETAGRREQVAAVPPARRRRARHRRPGLAERHGRPGDGRPVPVAGGRPRVGPGPRLHPGRKRRARRGLLRRGQPVRGLPRPGGVQTAATGEVRGGLRQSLGCLSRIVRRHGRGTGRFP